MIDPVAALGLAGNIVQFIDFSCKVLHDTKSLYGSRTGASAENDVIEDISVDLINLNNALVAPSEPGAIPDSIRSLASSCKGVAEEILEILNKIKVHGDHGKWKTFVQALRSVWKKEQIEELVKRMEKLRNETQYGLQLMLSEGQSEIQMMLASLVAENKRLKLDGMQQLEGLVKGIHDAISQLQAETKRRNETARDEPKAVQRLSSGDATEMTPSSPTWEDMKGLSNDIFSLAEEVRSSASDNMLLNSLWFDYIKHRQATVESAHEETFRWVLDPSSPTKFDDWVRSQTGIYWIVGKAGSGKSTLMKFLLNHTKTAESLKSWAGTKELVTASFFFWNSGSSMQKSQEGLFRSLLYEILSQCPDLTRTVCASKAKTFRPFVREVEPWSREELWHAIEQLKEQSGYDGDPDHIVSVLESLRSWPDIKLCISSRPYNEFIDAFGRSSDPQLTLEDLTREDIRIYVRNTLEENLRFRALKASDDRSQDLVHEIVEKARGVFLWVILVVRSLLAGLRNADRIYDLQKRLQEFPETLEKYFGHMITSVEPVYREQTAQAFEFALETERPLSLMMYSFLDEEDLDAVAAAPFNPLTTEEISSRQDDMRRRLNGRCKGLLEVVSSEVVNLFGPSTYTYRFHAPKVEFHHRTVRDFLHTKDMQNMLVEHLKAGFEPKLRFCKALLAQLKALDYSVLKDTNWLPNDLLEDLTHYASKLEYESHVPQSNLLDEVGRCVSKQAGLFKWKRGGLDFLEFLAQRRLHLYITETLTTRITLTRSDKSILLGSVLESPATKYFAASYDLKMIDILLQHGARPNDKYKDSTVWGNFLRSSVKGRFGATDDDNLPVIESLLSHGANLQQRIVTGQKTLARKMTGRAADLHVRQDVQVDVAQSAQKILLDLLGEEKTSEVLKKARKNQKSIPSSLQWWSGRSLLAFMKRLKR